MSETTELTAACRYASRWIQGYRYHIRAVSLRVPFTHHTRPGPVRSLRRVLSHFVHHLPAGGPDGGGTEGTSEGRVSN